MNSYTTQNSGGNTDVADRVETHVERLIRRISNDKRITPAHAKAVIDANGLLKETRSD